jgi:formyltetrahydrofolate synthetase
MKISYDREHDIMLLELSSKPIEFAEKMGPVIVHFTKTEKPVLLEILDASDFIATMLKSSLKATQEQLQLVH